MKEGTSEIIGLLLLLLFMVVLYFYQSNRDCFIIYKNFQPQWKVVGGCSIIINNYRVPLSEVTFK
jgi:hypothetical protein